MNRKKLTLILLSAVIVLLLAIIGVLYWKYQQASGNEVTKNKETSQRIIDKVANLYMVPDGEDPTVALIQDKEKLGNQEFFKKAQNGDYLLVYQKDKIALVYREKDNKLVNVGPVNLSDQDQQQGQTAGEQTQTGTETP
jgi:hypothetical protein